MAFPLEFKKDWLARIPEANQIPRISQEDFFTHNYETKLPCIITGRKDWACASWSPEFLQSVFADYTHTFRYSDSTGHDSCFITLPLQEYIQKLFLQGVSETPLDLPSPPSATEKVLFNIFYSRKK